MSWFPIFGSSPDAVVPQIYNWQNQSRAVEEANIARRSAAEDKRNSYWENVAQMERANQGVRNAMEQNEITRRENALSNAEARKINQYQFGQNLDLQKKQLSLYEKDAAARLKANSEELIFKTAQKAKADAADAAFDNQATLDQQLSGLNAALLSRVNAKNSIFKPGEAGTFDLGNPAIVNALDEIKFKVANTTKSPLHKSIVFDPAIGRFKIDNGTVSKYYFSDPTTETANTPPPPPELPPARPYTPPPAPAPALPPLPPPITRSDLDQNRTATSAVLAANPSPNWNPSATEDVPVSAYFGPPAAVGEALDKRRELMNSYSAQRRNPQAQFVLMIDPKGRTVKVPAEKVSQLRGYTLVK